MPLGEAASLWRAYMAAFTQLLSRMAGDPRSAAGQRLACLFTEALQLWGTLMCSRPARTTAVMRHLLVRIRHCMHGCSGWLWALRGGCQRVPCCLMSPAVLQGDRGSSDGSSACQLESAGGWTQICLGAALQHDPRQAETWGVNTRTCCTGGRGGAGLYTRDGP